MRVVADQRVPPHVPDLVGHGPLADRAQLQADVADAEQVGELGVVLEHLGDVAEVAEVAEAGHATLEDRRLDPHHARPLHAADAGAERDGDDVELGPRVGAERRTERRLTDCRGDVADRLRRSAVPAGAVTTTVVSPADDARAGRRPRHHHDGEVAQTGATFVHDVVSARRAASSRRTPLVTTVLSAGTSSIAEIVAAGKLAMSP